MTIPLIRFEQRRVGDTVSTRACANIALVKYWGKRDAALNLPAAGSLSLTLAALTTSATVRFDPKLDFDRMIVDGAVADAGTARRLGAWLDVVRERAGFKHGAAVMSQNHFPTASGLASSASAYAALALAAALAAGLDLDRRELSILARRGSGSAARSIYGGLVRLHGGSSADGNDCFAEPVPLTPQATVLARKLRMVIAIVGGGVAKKQSSRDAMEHSAETSPLYRGWIDCVPGDLAAAEAAIAAGDLPALGRVTEASALAMHAAAIASRPTVLYWQPATLAVMAAVTALREEAGKAAWYTMDAGPHVKVLTTSADAEAVAAAVRGVAGVTEVIVSAAGEAAATAT